MKPQVILYTRPGCCLCDDAKLVIAEARKRATFDFSEMDVDADPALARLYGQELPVITIDGRKAFKYAVKLNEFLRKLGVSI